MTERLSGVTAIIPTYNSEAFVRRAVESAIAQRPYVTEIIVVDDGSTDGTREAARGLDGIVRVLELPHLGNASVSRNRAIEAASGEFVAFLDADDVWLPGKISLQVEYLLQNTRVGFSCTNAYRQTSPDQEPPMPLLLAPALAPSHDRDLEALLADNFVIMSSVVARRQRLVDAGLFSESDSLKLVADYDLWVRMAAEAPFTYIPEPWLVYRDWGSSYRDEWSGVRTARSVYEVLDRVEQLYPEVASAHASAMARRRAVLTREMVVSALGAGDRSQAARIALAGIKEAPLLPLSWKSLARALLK